ncbi:MAG: hypothetical protein A3H96_05205 [Acidobacteria bacterium RIFCSPLOWO2_02_FULL_67_36]|nr:MAG: hypothetical protein A3H96_05205 [Acidobacteria bacterium RIFCSPLOWO2_02_FULL_67_36]OFW21641.1 MAG: hypothetical protein A3G21_14685 [Acidobacteria bacterium RIFCSPLOWO2_12_FULL_66_21]
MSPAALLIVVALLSSQERPAPPQCREWHECRQLALDAEGRGDYEAFHDLAWRAVQTGPGADTSLMYLLARAQSLSGRPSDALVMLQRLADKGIVTDAATNGDFARVRNLPGWAALAARLDARSTGAPAAASTVTPKASGTDERTREEPKREGTASAPAAASPETIRFVESTPTPSGLAYDAVSRRFLIADRLGRKLSVVDEFSQHVATLAGSQAGFGDIAALEIDPRDGDLWVVSGGIDGAHPTLHKLQLVSGRVLASYPVAESVGPVSLVDVAVTSQDAVLALDANGRRILRLQPRSAALSVAATIAEAGPASLAPAPGGIAFVATQAGVSRIDLSSRLSTPVRVPDGLSLSGVTRIRWHRGALVGVQRQDDGRYRMVRWHLDSRGRAVTKSTVLAADIVTPAETATSIAGDALYYLAKGDGGFIVARVKLTTK